SAALGVAVGSAARTAGAALTAVAALAAAPAPAAVPAGAAAVAAAGADRRQLLGRLAGDGGILGQAQTDAAALAFDLDDADLDLVAAVEDVLNRVDALARLDVADVQ